jgi:hypothetical protein
MFLSLLSNSLVLLSPVPAIAAQAELLRSQYVGPQTSCVEPPEGLISWWPGDASPEDIQDANDGRVINGATFASGMVGPAFSFDGFDDYVQVRDNASLNPGTGDFSVDFWMSTDVLGVELALLNKRAFCNEVSLWSINMGPDGLLSVEMYQGGNVNANTFTSDISVNDGTWHHVALVRQTTTATLYIDGAVHGSGSTEGITIIANTAPVLFGTDVCVGVNGKTHPYRGELDEIQYFNVALTSSQIQDIYNAGAAGQCKPEIFVFSIDPRFRPVGQLYNVGTSVTIQDTNYSPISKATVRLGVRQPDGDVIGYKLKTDDAGIASVSFFTSQTGTYTFTVVDVSLSSRTYDPSLNLETTDSITIP